MEDKNSFVMYKSWMPAIKSMSDEQAGKLIKAVYEFSVNPDVEIEDPAIRFVFEIIKETIKKDSEKYAETKEKRKAAVKARWDKENNSIQNETKDTNEYKCIEDIQKNTNDTVYVSESVSVSVNESVSESVSKDIKEKDSPTESRKRKTFTPPTLEEVEDFCRERNSPVDPKQFFDYFSTGNWIDSKGNKVRNWKQKILTWEKYKQGNGDNRASNITPFDANAYILSKINGGDT